MCTSFKISAKGEAAKLWPDHLRTFTPVPGLSKTHLIVYCIDDWDEIAFTSKQLLGNSVSSSASPPSAPPSPPLVVYLTEISFYCQPRLAE